MLDSRPFAPRIRAPMIPNYLHFTHSLAAPPRARARDPMIS